MSVMYRMPAEREFQTDGPATEKARSPHLVKAGDGKPWFYVPFAICERFSDLLSSNILATLNDLWRTHSVTYRYPCKINSRSKTTRCDGSCLVWAEHTTTRRLNRNPHGTITAQVVKVVWHKGLIAVFTRWRQYAPPSNMLPWTHLSRHPKLPFGISIQGDSDRFSGTAMRPKNQS